MLRPAGMLTLLAIAVLFGSLVPPFAPAGGAGSRAALPDLYILPGEVGFSTGADEIYAGYNVWVYVMVHNRGPGESASANVSFYLNGTFLSTVPVEDNLTVTEPFNTTDVYFQWNTTALLPGNYSLLIVVMDAMGDADSSNNNVTRNVTVRLEPPPPTEVKVTIYPPVQQARVSESAEGQVQFTGTVALEMAQGAFATVVLQSIVAPAWDSAIIPSSMVITDTRPHNFTVNVIVPQASRADIIGLLTVSATARGSSIEGTAHANVTVISYFRVMLESDMPYREVEPGQPATFNFKVWNVGNSVDDFNISITNRAELERKGWKLSLNRTSLRGIGPNNFSRVSLMVTPPQDFYIYKWENTMINIRVVSVGSERSQIVVAQSFPVYLGQKGFNKPLIGAISAAIGLLVAVTVIGIVRYRRKRRMPPGVPPAPIK